MRNLRFREDNLLRENVARKTKSCKKNSGVSDSRSIFIITTLYLLCGSLPLLVLLLLLLLMLMFSLALF